MFNALRWKLTAFNTAITGAIVVGMTLLCLLLSGRETRTQAFQNFTGNFTTLSNQLESRDQISTVWLRQMEAAGRFTVSIRDGGTVLYSMALSPEWEAMEPKFQQARLQAEKVLDSMESVQGGSYVFSLEESGGDGYFAGVAVMPKNGSSLELVCLYSLTDMQAALRRQQQVVWLAVLVAVALLGVFSWYFTGKMLCPIQENQRRQSQFVAAASHELRTPLAAILSAASAMEGADPECQARFSGIIQGEGKRMSRLVGDLLTLASADSQSWELRLQPVELDMLLLQTYEIYLPQAKRAGLTLTLNLPPAGGPAVSMDKDRMEQVLGILLDNALSYTPAPGNIGLNLTWTRTHARITVSDTGPGVPDEEKRRIFQRFHRGEKSRSDRTHFGLGLSIASEIIRYHRGRIWVEDTPGGGAAFLVELPL